MNWQKNTGVMPCHPEQQVAVNRQDGVIATSKAGSLFWGPYRYHKGENITHYCILEVPPPFDYVEPKVWTVKPRRINFIALHKRGEYQGMLHDISLDVTNKILDALNQMEERNGTH
jgi:hypothetical protein